MTSPRARERRKARRTEKFQEQVAARTEAVQAAGGSFAQYTRGTNIEESPPLQQEEADRVAELLGLPVPIPSIGGNLYSTFSVVTPEAFLEWLTAFNGENRDPFASNWKGIARDMEVGGWEPNHQAIGFVLPRTPEGNLINAKTGEPIPRGVLRPGCSIVPKILLMDGQHRARGGVESLSAIRTVVTINVRAQAIKAIDTHVRRTVRTVITLGESSMTVLMENMLKRAILGDQKGGSPSNVIVFEFAQRHMGSLEWFNEWLTKRVPRVMTAPTIAAVFRADLASDGKLRRELGLWLQVMREGTAEGANVQVPIKYRNWLLTGRRTGANASNAGHAVYCRTARMLNVFLQGESTEQVNTPGEDKWFPLPEADRLFLEECRRYDQQEEAQEEEA